MLIHLSLVIVAILSPMPASAAPDCSRDIRETIGCPTGAVRGDDVILVGDRDVPGHVPADEDSDGAGSDEDSSLYDQCRYIVDDRCLLDVHHGHPSAPAAPTAPITLRDIAAFRPDPAVDHMEPNGWTIALLDTNFYATGGAHTKAGTLLGQAASVRFTPVRWHWAYGDGTEASHPFPGGTWAAQGIPEFDPTGTSHIYRQYGTYYIDLDVEYEAEYRFGGGPWVDIDGTLTVPANQLVITAGDAKTVLVQRECTKNPRGPGC